MMHFNSSIVLGLLKPHHRKIALFFLILFSSLVFDSCSYYRKKILFGDQITMKEMNRNIAKDKQFVLMTPTDSWKVSNVKIEGNDELSMMLSSLEYTLIEDRLEYLKTTNKTQVKVGYGLLQQLVILHTNSDEDIKAGKLTLPFSSIKKVEVYDANVAKSVGLFIGFTLGLVVVFSVIYMLTKSSCPFLYVYNGTDFTLAAETFGGAIYPGLERSDFIALPEAKPLDGQYQFKLRNELQEIQYINKVHLKEARIPKNRTLGIDQQGKIHSVGIPTVAYSVLTDDREEVTETLANTDTIQYYFNNNSKVNNLTLSFSKQPEVTSAKLILKAKGTLWLDFVFGEFLKLFGTHYNRFAENQKEKTADQMQDWSREQYLPLSVSVRNNGEWQVIEEIQPIGPLAGARDIIIPIEFGHQGQETVQVRLSTGYNFWEIDYAGLDYTPNEPLDIRSSTMTTSQFNGIEINNGVLDATDEDYVIQQNVGDVLDFKIAPLFEDGANTMVFLEVGGYYTHIRDFKTLPDFQTLETFRTPGRLSTFSWELFHHHAAPMLARVQD